MKSITIFIFLFFFCMISNDAQNFALVIHGGAGNIESKNLKNADEYIKALDSALNIGYSILKSGGTSIDAVEQVVRYLEDNALFNAGRGAVMTDDGKVELDASIMDGKTLLAGAVAGVRDIKNPITAARHVMEKTSHVMLSGEGASAFAKKEGLKIVDNKYFIVKSIKERYNKIKNKHGTVGCVALDDYGNLAAGTSTGGMMMKKYGRIGDSPIIGAGTYANNQTCAVSCTGHGEFFIRNVIAFHVHALMLYKNLDINSALKYVVDSVLTPQGGTGGLIAIDKNGNTGWYFNTKGMFRASVDFEGNKIIRLFSE